MVKSAVRVFGILQFVAKQPNGLTHAQISQGLSIPRASLSALLSDLVELHYLDLDERTRRYTLGAQVLTLCNAYLRNLNVVQIGEPILRDVFRETGEFTSLVIARGTEVVKVCEFAPPDPLGLHLQVGEAGPMHATAGGKALLAYLAPAVRDEVISKLEFRVYTKKTIRTKAQLIGELKEIQSRGIAYCRGEYLEGMVSMAAAVFNAGHQPVAAIGVNTPAVRFTQAYERKVVKILETASARLSARLGNRNSLTREFTTTT